MMWEQRKLLVLFCLSVLWDTLKLPDHRAEAKRINVPKNQTYSIQQSPSGSLLIKKFPTFYGTRRFITAFTSARHLFLFWARSVHWTLPCLLFVRSILTLFSHLCIYMPPLVRPRSRWEDNIKMDLEEVGRGCGGWMELAQDRDSWRALVSTVMNFGVS